jgi:hypothetical protein
MAWHGRPAKAYSVTLTMTMTFLSVNHRPERERQFFCDPFEVNDAIKRILADLSVSISTTTTTTTTNLVDGRLFLFCGWMNDHGLPVVFQDWIQLDSTYTRYPTFALLGVAAVLARIQRWTVSLRVILVEGTDQIKVLLLSGRHESLGGTEWGQVLNTWKRESMDETSMELKKYLYRRDHEDYNEGMISFKFETWCGRQAKTLALS